MENYNQLRARTLIGAWQEARALEAEGKPSRLVGREAKFAPTKERVMPQHSNAGPSTWVSQSVDASKAILSKAPPTAGLGPRQRLVQERIQNRAEAYATAVLTPEETGPSSGAGVLNGTTTSRDFAAYSASDYKARVRRPVLNAAGTGAAEDGLVSCEPHVAKGASGSTRAAIAGLSSPVAESQVPVTYYTARLVDGVFPKTGIRNLNNPFAKSYAFSNPIEEGERVHAETTESSDPEKVTYMSRSTAVLVGAGMAAAPLDKRIPGVSLALQRLFLRLLRRLAESRGAGPGGAHSCFAAFLTDIRSSAGDYVGSLEQTSTGVALDDSHILQESMRAKLHEMKLSMPDREVETIISACDDDASGRASLPLFFQIALTTIPQPRRDALNAVYSSVAGDVAHLATVTELAGRFNVEATSEVTSGRATPEDVVNGFLSFFLELGCDEDVSADIFACYFAPLSACVEEDKDFTAYLQSIWGLGNSRR